MTACAFSSCTKLARARGYCWPHYVQLRRAKGDESKLKPLRGSQPPMVRVSIRLSRTTATAVREDVGGARATLDVWADKKGKKGGKRNG